MTTPNAEAASDSDSTGNPLTVVNIPSDLLLVIFIHGFKGDNDTFAKFPERLQHILTETVPNCKTECIVFPAYEVRFFSEFIYVSGLNRANSNGFCFFFFLVS